MVKYIIKRLLISVLILFGVSIILYALLRAMPGDYVTNKFTSNPNVENSAERIEQMKALYGLDTDIFTGRIYSPGRYRIYRDLHEEPVFARAGSIIPLYRSAESNDLSLRQPLEIWLYSGDGSFDMFAIVKALYDTGFDGVMRPDHGRMIWGEQAMPGYGLYDRALGSQYLLGLWEAITKLSHC